MKPKLKKPKPHTETHDDNVTTLVGFWAYHDCLIESVAVTGGIYSGRRLDRFIAALIKHRDWLRQEKRKKLKRNLLFFLFF